MVSIFANGTVKSVYERMTSKIPFIVRKRHFGESPTRKL